MMKYNNALITYSLIDCISVLSEHKASSLNRCLPAIASGIAAVLYLPNKIEQRYKDVTFNINFYPAILKNILGATGREYEVIQKFGGVYSEQYYIYRIIQSLTNNSPIICKSSHADANWCLLVGYDNKNKLAYLKTPLRILATKTLYQDIDDMILFSNEKKIKPTDCLPNDFINAVTTMEQISLSEYGNAYDIWIRFLKDLSSDIPEMYKFHHHVLQRLLQDRRNLYVYLKQEAFFNFKNGFENFKILMDILKKFLLSTSILPELLISQVYEIQNVDKLLRHHLYSYFR